MTKIWMALLLAVAFCLATGCGDDGGTGDASGDTSTPDGGDAIVGDTSMPDAPPQVCGDGTLTAPEQCDDGNTMAGDGCDDMCNREASATCGDGTVDRPAEECDDGNMADGDGCSAACLVEAPTGCGDGSLDLSAGEECDDGNTAAGDGCGPTCQLEPVGMSCGDGTMDPAEVCDDGNTMNGDGCNPTCNLANTTSLFVGMPGMTGSVDGIGTVARIRGGGTLAADATYLWYAQGAGMGGSPPAQLRRIEISTGDVLSVATLSGAGGVATNGSDTVWVAGSGTIESIGTSPPYTVTTIHDDSRAMGAGSFADGAPGTATFGDVRGLTWYGGYLWIVDTVAAVIRRMDPATGDVTTVGGTPYTMGAADGVGPAASFTSPRYIVSDGSGMLYISDTNGQTIRAMNAVTFAVTTFAGVSGMAGHTDGIGAMARIHRPRGITADASSIYFAEFNAHTIRQGVLATQEVTTLAGMADTSGGSTGGYTEGTGLAAEFANPFSVAYHFPSRSLFVVDGGNSVIRRIQ